MLKEGDNIKGVTLPKVGVEGPWVGVQGLETGLEGVRLLLKGVPDKSSLCACINCKISSSIEGLYKISKKVYEMK